MSDKTEPFFRRWSRLKHESEQPRPDSARDDGEPPPLPPIEELGPDSDYSGFMHPKVDPELRRAALKKLFSSERFRSMDGLDVYVGDYSNPEPLDAGVAATLLQASAVLAAGNDQKLAADTAQENDTNMAESKASPEAPASRGSDEDPESA